MLTKLNGIWIGILDGRPVAIIDLDKADPDGMKAIDDLINERRRNGRRHEHGRISILVRSEEVADVEV